MTELHRLVTANGRDVHHAIFIHGLGGDAKRTWCSGSNPEECWLPWLSQDIGNLAIWSVGYPAAFTEWKGHALHIVDRAQNILQLLLAQRELRQGNIALVGHSMGGLLIKLMIQLAEQNAIQGSNNKARAREFLDQLRKVVFIATPHAGSPHATIVNMLRILGRPSAAMESLLKNDPNLRHLNQWYREWAVSSNVGHLILAETLPMPKIGLIVPIESADPGLVERPILLDCDHASICKPGDRNSEIYALMRSFIENIGETIENDSKRWEEGTSERSVIVHGERTAEIVAEKLQKTFAYGMLRTEIPIDLVDREIDQTLKRIRRTRFIGGSNHVEMAEKLANDLLLGRLTAGSTKMRAGALAWCSRFLSEEMKEMSEQCYESARKLNECDEVKVAKAFLEKGGERIALKVLGDLNTPYLRSSAVFLVAKGGRERLFDWLTVTQTEIDSLDAEGKAVVLGHLVEDKQWEKLTLLVGDLSEDCYVQAPVLLYLSACVYLSNSVPAELRDASLQTLPLNLSTYPLSSGEEGIHFRNLAITYFQKTANRYVELGLNRSANIAADFSLWLRLRSDEHVAAAREELIRSIGDKEHSIRRVWMAESFNVGLDLEAVEREIDKQIALGNDDADIALARLACVSLQKTAKESARYFQNHREFLREHLLEIPLRCIEIEYLIKAGERAEAAELFGRLEPGQIDDENWKRLQKLFAISSGANPIQEGINLFKATNSVGDLHSLVLTLEAAKEWEKVCEYGTELFSRTRAITHAEILANALQFLGRNADLANLLESFGGEQYLSSLLKAHFCWVKYSLGEFELAKSALKPLINEGKVTGLIDLKAAISVSSGKWEELVDIVRYEWENKGRRTPEELIKAAKVSLSIRGPYSFELLQYAVEASKMDANILSAAYFAAVNAGFEDREDVATWLSAALISSGENGPIKTMSLQELVDSKPEWDRQETEYWEKVAAGEMPMFAIGGVLNQTLIDIVLNNFLANVAQDDVRKRFLISSFSGVRGKVESEVIGTLSLDPTALFTMGATGILEKVMGGFEKIQIPHSLLGWLFGEFQRISFHQPSRIKRSNQIRQWLANGSLKEFSPTRNSPNILVSKVGEDLAAFLDEAEHIRARGLSAYVVRSAPVQRVGSLATDPVDLIQYQSVLCSCSGLIRKLRISGEIMRGVEDESLRYLGRQEQQWSGEPEIADNSILFLDDLSVSYLHHCGVLGKVRRVCKDVFISARAVREVEALIAYETRADQVLDVIESVRKILANGIEAGRVIVAAEHASEVKKRGESHPDIYAHPTMAAMGLLGNVDAIVIDDRYLNQNRYIEDAAGRHVPVLTSIDVIAILTKKAIITREEMMELRSRLCRAGYFGIQVEADEYGRYLEQAVVSNGRVVETAELRNIREYFLLVQMRNFLQLPKEGVWIESTMREIRESIRNQWRRDISTDDIKAYANWLISLTDLRGWIQFLPGVESDRDVTDRLAMQLTLLVNIATELPQERRAEYCKWFETTLMNYAFGMPEISKALVVQVKRMLLIIISGKAGQYDQ